MIKTILENPAVLAGITILTLTYGNKVLSYVLGALLVILGILL